MGAVRRKVTRMREGLEHWKLLEMVAYPNRGGELINMLLEPRDSLLAITSPCCCTSPCCTLLKHYHYLYTLRLLYNTRRRALNHPCNLHIYFYLSTWPTANIKCNLPVSTNSSHQKFQHKYFSNSKNKSHINYIHTYLIFYINIT